MNYDDARSLQRIINRYHPRFDLTLAGVSPHYTYELVVRDRHTGERFTIRCPEEWAERLAAEADADDPDSRPRPPALWE